MTDVADKPKRVGWRAPTYNELVRALRHSHEHHGFRPTHCTPKNCTVAEMLARIDAQGDARFRIHRVADVAPVTPAETHQQKQWRLRKEEEDRL